MGPKYFEFLKFWAQKILVPKNIGIKKKFWVEKNLGYKKNQGQQNLVPKNLGKKVLSQKKMLGQKKFC